MQTIEARQDRARALPGSSDRPLRPAAASTLAPSWVQGQPVPAEVAAVFDQAVYLRRGQDVLPLLAPEALLLPGALRVATRADLDALQVQAGQDVHVGLGEVRTPGGGLVVRRAWRPQRVPTAPLPDAARRAARAGLAGLEPIVDDHLTGRLVDLAAAAVHGLDEVRREAVRGLVGLGPGLTPAGDDVLCGLLLGLRASGQDGERSRLADAVSPLLGRTTALSATLLRQAAQGYAVPPVVAVLRAWHRGAGVPALRLAGHQVARIGHTSGPALVLGLRAALAAPHTRSGPSDLAHPRAGHRPVRDPARPDPARPDLARPDLARPDLARPDLARPDLARPDLVRPHLAPLHPAHHHPEPVVTSTAATRGTS